MTIMKAKLMNIENNNNEENEKKVSKMRNGKK